MSSACSAAIIGGERRIQFKSWGEEKGPDKWRTVNYAYLVALLLVGGSLGALFHEVFPYYPLLQAAVTSLLFIAGLAASGRVTIYHAVLVSSFMAGASLYPLLNFAAILRLWISGCEGFNSCSDLPYIISTELSLESFGTWGTFSSLCLSIVFAVSLLLLSYALAGVLIKSWLIVEKPVFPIIGAAYEAKRTGFKYLPWGTALAIALVTIAGGATSLIVLAAFYTVVSAAASFSIMGIALSALLGLQAAIYGNLIVGVQAGSLAASLFPIIVYYRTAGEEFRSELRRALSLLAVAILLLILYLVVIMGPSPKLLAVAALIVLHAALTSTIVSRLETFMPLPLAYVLAGLTPLIQAVTSPAYLALGLSESHRILFFDPGYYVLPALIGTYTKVLAERQRETAGIDEGPGVFFTLVLAPVFVGVIPVLRNALSSRKWSPHHFAASLEQWSAFHTPNPLEGAVNWLSIAAVLPVLLLVITLYYLAPAESWLRRAGAAFNPAGLLAASMLMVQRVEFSMIFIGVFAFALVKLLCIRTALKFYRGLLESIKWGSRLLAPIAMAVSSPS